MIERSLVLIKHDGVSRGLIGVILSRFEQMSLKIIGMKMIHAEEELAKNHYRVDEEWAKQAFEKTRKTYETEGKKNPYKDPMEFGRILQKWNVTFLREGPVIAFVLSGPHTVEIARKLVGNTEPRQAMPGTIRGDFAMVESYAVANKKERVLRNLVHASDSVDNAEREIALWFKPHELYDYRKELDKHF